MNKNNGLGRLWKSREIPVLLFILLLILFFSITIEGFFTFRNFQIISRQITTVGIVALGMTLVILTGGIDLSVGSILAFSINIGGLAILAGWPIYTVYPLILLLGASLGLINGALITWIKVPALIITLGTMNIYRGIIMIITGGAYITRIPREYSLIGTGYVPFIFFMVVLVIFVYVTFNTKMGRNLFAIGGGSQASEFSGVPVKKYRILVYVISGFLSALSGIILVGRSGFIQPQSGMGYELDTIAAVVIGGTSIFGGTGSVLGTFLGSALMGLIIAGLTMLAVDAYWHGLITGILIILAISLDTLRQMKRS